MSRTFHGRLEGPRDFSIAHLDEYKVVISMDLFRMVNAIPMPCIILYGF